MTKKEILEKYNLSSFINADLRDASLIGADLRDADLRGADLSGADLRGADLSGAHLSGAHLSGADLREADLRNSYLFGVKSDHLLFNFQLRKHSSSLINNYLRIGCENQTIDWWKANYEEIGKKHDYSPTDIVQYKRLIDFCQILYNDFLEERRNKDEK